MHDSRDPRTGIEVKGREFEITPKNPLRLRMFCHLPFSSWKVDPLAANPLLKSKCPFLKLLFCVTAIFEISMRKQVFGDAPSINGYYNKRDTVLW